MRKILTNILLLFSLLAFAQNPMATGIPYSCSFEESEDLSAWVMNNPSTATDKWIIGTMVHSEGQRSMFVSIDGKNPSYGSHPNIVVSYLRFKFPETGKQQNYDISFDWKGIGDPDNSKLYVMVCREDLLTNSQGNNPYYLPRIVSATSGIISPNVVNQACQQIGPNGDRFLCGSEQWQNATLTNELRVNTTNAAVPFAIVFIWVNNNSDPNVRQSGICIDNFAIGDATVKKPKNVQVEPFCEDSSLIVSWESGLNEFEVQYRKVGTGTWRRQDGITDGVDGFTRNGLQCSYRLQRIVEATYDVRVLGVAGALKSNYSYKNQTLVYCPENHCVAYLDLDGPNVDCTHGYHPNTDYADRKPYDPYYWHERIDYGSDSELSRHTIHTDPTETDPRTDDELPTVPPGALASVRLGSWDATGEAEAITYNFTVDAINQGILIVKYATVVEYSGHPRNGEPFFRLEVLDEQGNLIDESCGHADYAYSDAKASGDLSGWHISKSDTTIAWKEWTTVGVNLQPYAGQNIKVRFTTSDCYQSVHYGYAYFTVDCASARLETENCGNDAKIECYAPEGFSYMWFNEAGDTVGTDRELIVDPGRQEYTCRVSFIEDEECYFEVKTLSAPRFPVPEYTVEPIYDQCSSKLKFHNTSHVMNKYDGEENHTKEPTEDGHWYFRRLSDNTITESYNWNPVYTCPVFGDSIEVTYVTYIGLNNACDSVRVDTFVTPNIVPEPTVFHMETCPESPVYFGDQWFNTDTTYVGVFPNFAGCDSTSTLHLKVWPKPQDLYRHDSICSDGSVMINGVKFTQPVENYLIMMKTVHGCDSAMYFTLTVNERIQTDVPQWSYACADDNEYNITFDINAGQFDSLEIHFSTPELRDTVIYDANIRTVSIPYPATITPGHYTATLSFYQFCCGRHTEIRDIDIRYRASIVEQKWNDVLSVLAPKYNGGYEFTTFQWYKNGELLPGETRSYLYQPLDFTADYYVVVTRPDGVQMATCPITPVYHEQISDYPTIVQANQMVRIRLENPTKVYIYSALGQLVNSYQLTAGDAVFQTPAQAGIYIIRYEED
ncbi:MAG: hypothetical protein II588_02450 [Paludibacteraceae bacterium]|nr:hypothetical protein [Paludibacteraceae bacterium]